MEYSKVGIKQQIEYVNESINTEEDFHFLYVLCSFSGPPECFLASLPRSIKQVSNHASSGVAANIYQSV